MGVTDYTDLVCDELSGTRHQDTILVGHSLAGWTIPLVASRIPVQRTVYLCAGVPMPGRSLMDQLSEEADLFLPEILVALADVDEHHHRWKDPSLAKRLLFADCDDQLAEAAIARLRPQALGPLGVRWPLDHLPSVPATYIRCSADQFINPTWSERVVSARLHADLITLPGSHSPFLSRPKQLADVLHALTM